MQLPRVGTAPTSPHLIAICINASIFAIGSMNTRLRGSLEQRIKAAAGHDRHSADTVLWAAFDHPITVGNVYQHRCARDQKTNDLKLFEQEAAALIETCSPSLSSPTMLIGRSAGRQCWRRWYPRQYRLRP